MSRRNTILVILLLLLGSAYLLLRPRDDAGQGAGAVHPFDFEVQRISVSGPDVPEWSIVRGAHRWHLEAPFPAPVAEEAVEQLLTLAESLAVEPIDIPAGDLAPYGLLPDDRFEITMESADGTERSLYLGRELPLDVIHTYTLVPGAETLYRTLTDFRSLFAREPGSLIDDRLLPLDEAKLSRMEAMTPGERFTVLREGEEFRLNDEAKSLADADRLRGLLRALRESRIGRSRRRDSDGRPVAEEASRLSLTFESGETLELGFITAGSDGGAAVEVLSSLWPEHLLAPRDAVELPALKSTYFLDRRLLPVEGAAVQRVAVSFPDGGVILRRDGAEWQVYEPGAPPAEESTAGPGEGDLADTGAVLAALRSLGSLRGGAFVEREPSGPVVLSLDLRTADDTLHRLEVHRETEGLVAVASRYSRPLSLDPQVVESLRVDPEAFVDTSLVAFELSQVRSIRIAKKSGDELQISREADGDWYLRRPRSRLLETPQVVRFLFALQELEHAGPVERARGAEEAEEELRVTLEDASGAVVAWLSLRPEAAASSRVEGVYRLPPDRAREVVRLADQF